MPASSPDVLAYTALCPSRNFVQTPSPGRPIWALIPVPALRPSGTSSCLYFLSCALVTHSLYTVLVLFIMSLSFSCKHRARTVPLLRQHRLVHSALAIPHTRSSYLLWNEPRLILHGCAEFGDTMIRARQLKSNTLGVITLVGAV